MGRECGEGLPRTGRAARAFALLVLALSAAGLASGQEPLSPPTPPAPAQTTPTAAPASHTANPPGAPGAGIGTAPPPRPAGPLGAAREVLTLPGVPRPSADSAPPGLPPRGGRPLPGGPLDPGASGPGIGRSASVSILGGAFDPRTGWPFVLLDHFRPRPERLERFSIVQTRDCPQVMGTDPWPCLRVLHFNAEGTLEQRSPAEKFDQVVGHPAFVQVQGSLTIPDAALGGLLWSHSWLQLNGVLAQDAVTIAFDWPSQRVYQNPVKDINEKGRRAYIAGFHLARFLQGFPPASRIALLGQSYGGRVVPSALHLLGGGALNSQDHDPPVSLAATRPDL